MKVKKPRCSHCNKTCNKDDMYYVKGKTICEDCYNS